MSGTLITQTSGATSGLQAYVMPSAATTTSGPSPSTPNPLGSLTDNYQTFLTMLTTQLKNQDPTSPMDSSQFTSELVQFSSVEQQIQTNSSLTQLIQLTQGESAIQASQLVGKSVEVNSPDITLQQGAASIHYTSPAAGPVTIAVYDSTGHQIMGSTVSATQGQNSWTWNGQSSTGIQQPDGPYRIGVMASSTSGSVSPLTFTVIGKATSVHQTGSSVQIQLGGLNVDMSAVVSVGG